MKKIDYVLEDKK